MNHASPTRVAQRHLVATRTAGADVITSRLKGIKLGPGGGVHSVEKLSDTEWLIEPDRRQRLDHYGNGGEGWDQEGWDDDYSVPLAKAAQGWLDTKFEKGLFDADVDEKGYLFVHLTNAGKAHFGVS